MQITNGDIYENGRCYTMIVKDVRDDVVVWDGIYDKGYETPIGQFKKIILDPDSNWRMVRQGESMPAAG